MTRLYIELLNEELTGQLTRFQAEADAEAAEAIQEAQDVEMVWGEPDPPPRSYVSIEALGIKVTRVEVPPLEGEFGD